MPDKLDRARRAVLHALANSVGVLIPSIPELRRYVHDPDGLTALMDMERAARRSLRTFQALHRARTLRLSPASLNRLVNQVSRMTADLQSLRSRMLERDGFNVLDDMDLAAARASAQLASLRDLV
jgi:hypothetical protein